jgi:hypothetical protein
MEAAFLVVVILAIGGYFAWQVLRGENVGSAKGVMQGEYAVPGALVSAVVKRHMSGGRPGDVEIVLWTWGVARTFKLAPRDALALAQALEAAAAEIRGEA